MAASLNKTLLDGERNFAPKIQRRTVAVSAALAALLLSSTFVAYSYGKNAAEQQSPMLRNITKLDSSFPFTPQCYSFTGHQCSANSPCEENGMTCVQDRCLCDHQCAGADGHCWLGSGNVKVNTNPLHIMNKKWNNYKLYVPYFAPLQQMRVARWCLTCAGFVFDIYKLPGGNFKGHPRYLLSLSNYPDKVVGIQKSTADISPWGFYAMSLVEQTAPQDISVRICNMKSLLGFDAIKIGKTLENGHNVWARVHEGSMFVYGWDTQAEKQDPTDKGYWTLDDPTLYDKFEMCEA